MPLLENREIYFLLFFFGALGFSWLTYPAVRRLAILFAVLDEPNLDRKIHGKPIPSLGGLVIYTSFAAGLVVLALSGGTDEVSGLKMAGILLGGAVLVIGGVLDSKFDLSPAKQIVFPVLAALLVVFSGSHISYITNPLGGAIVLDGLKFFDFPVLGSLLVFFWILGMTYTTKFLDGMDGLATGIAGIAGIVIFGLSLAPDVNQTTTAFLALIFAGACFGFLKFNWYPARMFLGEGGSTLTGFLIAVLAVISGAKIATALLVLGIPVLDTAWVILQRLIGKRSPFVGDNKHLHFRLLDIGMSQRQAVLFLWLLAAIFGSMAVFLQSLGKFVALVILAVVMAATIIGIAWAYRKKKTKISNF